MSTQQTPAASGPVEQQHNGDVSHTNLSWLQCNADSKAARQEIRANETALLDREWERLDETVFPVIRDNLVLYDQIQSAGLTTDITMAHTESTWQVSDDLTDAEYSMDARTRSEEDSHAFARQGVPIPFVHKDYRIGERELQASRNMGDGIDTMMARTAGRKVSEALEELILNGAPGIQVNSDAGMLNLPGLRNYGDRIQYTGSSWDTPANVKDDLNNGIELLEEDAIYAGGTPYWLIHGTGVSADFRNDYNTDGDMTVRERVNDFSEIGEVIHVPSMPDNEALLLKPIPEFIDIARDPEGVQNVQWETHGGFEHQFKVLALAAPRLKSDVTGRTGILHISGI